MFGIIISVIVLLTMGYLILKNYKPQVVLAAPGPSRASFPACLFVKSRSGSPSS